MYHNIYYLCVDTKHYKDVSTVFDTLNNHICWNANMCFFINVYVRKMGRNYSLILICKCICMCTILCYIYDDDLTCLHV